VAMQMGGHLLDGSNVLDDKQHSGASSTHPAIPCIHFREKTPLMQLAGFFLGA
jgi:hypothetical protein